jgi:hypothetical protein
MMADSNPPDARKLADSIDSSSPWQDAKNDTKKLEAEPTLMEFDLTPWMEVALLLQHHVIHDFKNKPWNSL